MRHLIFRLFNAFVGLIPTPILLRMLRAPQRLHEIPPLPWLPTKV